MPDHGLGRIYKPDARDANFPMRALLPTMPSTRTYRYWSASGWWGDQGQTPQCVAYAWLHFLEDGPIPQGGKNPPPVVVPATLYKLAQQKDETPGENYDGTSTRGGVKAVQSLGFVSAYHWATSLDDVVQALLEV